MSLAEIISAIHEWMVLFMPFIRTVWVAVVAMGVAMLIIAFMLKKNPERKKSPWIVGGCGLLMVISSGTQLIMSII